MKLERVFLMMLIEKLSLEQVEYKPFNEVCEYIRGITYNKSQEAKEQNEKNWKVLRANNIDLQRKVLDLRDVKEVDSSVKVKESQRLRKNDILICAGSGSKEHIGKVAFITEEMVQRGYEAVKRNNACVMGMPSKDTVKLADSSGYVKETPDRKIVWNIQTPQIFSYDLIRGAYESIRKKDMTGVTDDAMVVEQETGTKILLVEGSYQNIKITTPEDLAIAEAFLRY